MGQSRPENTSRRWAIQNVVPPSAFTRNLTDGLGMGSMGRLRRRRTTARELLLQQAFLNCAGLAAALPQVFHGESIPARVEQQVIPLTDHDDLERNVDRPAGRSGVEIDGTANSFSPSGSEAGSGFRLRLGRLMPEAGAEVPELPG